MTRRIHAGWLGLFLVLISGPTLKAQMGTVPARALTLEEAVHYALVHYPAVRAALEQVNSARSGVALARTTYLPQLNPIYQANRATQNNIIGLSFPSPIAPSITGPVQPYSATSFWNTQAGALLSWEPFDFGLRRATVDQARSAENKSSAEVELTRLQVASATCGYFLNSVSAQQAVTAAQANVRRWEVFDQTVRVLVEQQLRPGADGSRADAELAAARTKLFQEQAVEQQAQALLASLLGAAPGAIQIEPSLLLVRDSGAERSRLMGGCEDWSYVGKTDRSFRQPESGRRGSGARYRPARLGDSSNSPARPCQLVGSSVYLACPHQQNQQCLLHV
jgi:outer membrane protein TolC